jgi:signal transduction histidine kinase
MTEVKMLKAESESLANKPFGLLKFFSFSALVLFLVSTITLVWLISDYTKKMLLERSEASALVLAENLNHQVFQQFVLPTIMRYGKIALRNEDQFSRLDTIVKNVTHGLNFQSVSIFDREEGVVSYSTIPENVGKKDLVSTEYEKALTGESNSSLIVEGSLFSFLPGRKGIVCNLKTFIPLRQEERLNQNTGPIMGVFEIVQDLSEDLEALVTLQGVIIGTSVLIMSALFGVLWLIVARGERIIDQRAKERMKLEEKLNHAERLAGLGKMVASVSHEIKNPLGIVRSTAEILEKRLKKLAPGNEHLAGIIIQETSRLDGIVREFLDFARPQHLNADYAFVSDVLRRSLAFMGPEFEKGRITVHDTIASTAPQIRIDSNQLHQAFLNLLVNALHSMPKGGELRVSTAEDSKKKRQYIRIEDTGVGMSAEVSKQIFKPFYTKKNRGTGLGLTIVKNIIEAHAGTITVESKEGEGTTFLIDLPAGSS